MSKTEKKNYITPKHGATLSFIYKFQELRASQQTFLGAASDAEKKTQILQLHRQAYQPSGCYSPCNLGEL